MIVYKGDRINRMKVAEAASLWRVRDIISKEEYILIRQAYAGGYTEPSVLMRIGYFIFASFCCIASLGIILLMFATSSHSMSDVAVACLFWGAALIFVNELLVSSREMYRSGITHALLGFGLAGVFVSVGVLLNERTNAAHLGLSFFLAFACIGFFAYRYLSAAFSVASWMCFLCFVFFTLASFGSFGFLLVPFAGMAFSTLLYILTNRIDMDKWVFHTASLQVLKGVALFSFYLSGNYFVIHALSSFKPGDTVEIGVFFTVLFYSLTLLLPIVYCVYGLARKNRLFLRTGLICVLLAIATIRYFHSFLPAEIGLTLGGILLCSLAVAMIRMFKTERHGITSAPDLDSRSKEKRALSEISKLVIASVATSSGQTSDPQEGGIEMGGGSGGGAGAGGAF